jgi:hypothetical protein
LKATGVLRDAHVTGTLSLRSICDGDQLRGPVGIHGCALERLEAPAVEFLAPVVLEQTTIGYSEFFSAYFLAGVFLAGVTVRACRFTDVVDFQCGGHNRDGAAVRFEDCSFDGFVNPDVTKTQAAGVVQD